MNQISDIPDRVSDAGLDFDYTKWTPGTHVKLCTVPWDNTYRDVVDFPRQTALDEYLDRQDGPKTSLRNTQYIRPNTPIRISIPFAEAFMFNYLRVHNPAQPTGSDIPATYYYFILDMQHVAPNTTELVVQLDVWQTFRRGVRFGRCYVERGHIGIANRNADAENGRRYLTVPEGFDTGSILSGVGRKDIVIKTPAAPVSESVGFVIVTVVSIEESGGSVSDPELVSAKGTAVNGLPSGAEFYYAKTFNDVIALMSTLSTRPWIAQGIISMYVVPNMIMSDGNVLQPANVPGTATLYKMQGTLINNQLVTGTGTSPGQHYKWRSEMLKTIPSRYRHLTKFLTFPYCSVEFTTFNAQPLILQPELLPNDELRLDTAVHLTPPSPKVAIWAWNYNSGLNGENSMGYSHTAVDPAYLGVPDDFGEGINNATYISNFPQLPFVSNNYIAYMAANANSIAYQYDSANWSQQRALAGNQLSYNQAGAAMELSDRLNQLGMGANFASQQLGVETQGYRSIQQGINGVIGGAISGAGSGGMRGGPWGAVGGAILGGGMAAANTAADYAISVNQMEGQGTIQRSLMNNTNNATVANMGYMRDSNKSYADMVANGDYQNAIAGINARIQDAKLTQPSLVGQYGGEALVVSAVGRFTGRIILKRVDNNVITAIGEFWLRYGYAVNRFHNLGTLSLMSNFTYWKLLETNIHPDSKCPEHYRNTIRGILEKGVTVWRNPDHINNLDIGNNSVTTLVDLR